MDPVRNPYSPGAGTPPPELAGRDRLREQVRIALARLRAGRSAKSVLMVGLRGVGKTVLLDQLMRDAEADGICTVRSETPENRSLPALLAPQIRLALLHLNRTESAKDAVARGLRALAGFAMALKVKYHDLEVGFDAVPEPGLADNGDLEMDLTALIEEVGRAAKGAGTAVVLFIDELQYLPQDQFAALIAALHRSIQRQLPVTIVGAGLHSFARSRVTPNRTPSASSNFRRLARCLPRKPSAHCASQPQTPMWNMPMMPLPKYWREPRDIHISCRSGEIARGTSLPNRRLHARMWSAHRRRRSPHWTRVFSVFDSIGSHRRRSDTCGRWPNLGPELTAPETSLDFWKRPLRLWPLCGRA